MLGWAKVEWPGLYLDLGRQCLLEWDGSGMQLYWWQKCSWNL